MGDAKVDEIIAEVQFDVRGHDLAAALAAGHLRPATRVAGLSLADRALARTLRLPALTADRGWLGLADAVGVRIDVIR